eukprot:gene30557-biopygen26116
MPPKSSTSSPDIGSRAVRISKPKLGECAPDRRKNLSTTPKRRRANEDTLRLAARVFAATQDAIVIADAGGTIVATNPAFTAISGYDSAEMVGRHVSTLQTVQRNTSAYQAMMAALAGHGHWSGEMLARRKNGATFPGLLSVSTVAGANGEVENYIVVFMDITERKAEQHMIDFLSYHDALTGLPNRLLARQCFDEAQAAAQRNGQCVGVMCLDLDRFKSVNDSYGAPVGDQALQAVARLLRSCVPDGATVSRQGGDEFQIIVPDDAQLGATVAAAQAILAGLRDGLPLGMPAAGGQGAPQSAPPAAQPPTQLSTQHLGLTTSIGIAVCPAAGSSCDSSTSRTARLPAARSAARWLYSIRMTSSLRKPPGARPSWRAMPQTASCEDKGNAPASVALALDRVAGCEGGGWPSSKV